MRNKKLGAGYTYPEADDFILENGSNEYTFRFNMISHRYGYTFSFLCTLVVFYGR